MKKILVTGGAGFIGGHVAAACLERGNEVVVLDNLHTGSKDNITLLKKLGGEKFKFWGKSILDSESLHLLLEGVDTVFHLAALVSVPESLEKKYDYVSINTIGTLNVLEACKNRGVKNFVLSSSAAIYGDNLISPKQEAMMAEPKSPYAITKLDGEYYCALYREQYGLNATALRYFNVFGPRQSPESQYAAAVPIFINNALRNRELCVYGDGGQTRDFIYVDDIVQANLLAAENRGTVYNVACGGKTTIKELAEKIVELTGSKSKIKYLSERLGDIKHSRADNSKIIKELGFKVGCTLDRGLLDTISYFKEIQDPSL